MSIARDDRVERIVALVSALAAGDLDARADPDGLDDELDAIIVGVNMLGEELEAWRDELEQRVRDRTAALHHLSLHDALTGLGNRTLLDQEAAKARDDDRVALLVLDLDGFKAINDTFGHATGDRVLVELARRLGAAIRPDDVAVRLGGDEFAVLLRGADEATARVVGHRVLAEIDRPVVIDARELHARASVGLAVGLDEASLEVLLRQADASMYEAKKRLNGAPMCVFDEARHSEMLDTLALSTELTGVQRRGELVLHYQPIVEMQTRRIIGHEALVRWQHPQRGLISPGVLIPLAETMGLMGDIGLWVLQEACLEAGTWPEIDGCRPYVSVNLAVQQLRDPRFPALVDAALQAGGLAAERLVVEITERTFAAVDVVSPALQRLRDAGVRAPQRLHRRGSRRRPQHFMLDNHGYDVLPGKQALLAIPMDASDADDLAGAGNLRLDTDLGPLDVMQWIAGIDVDNLYAELDASALSFTLDDVPHRYCSLGHLRAMKEAAGRPRDLDDLEHLPPADT